MVAPGRSNCGDNGASYVAGATMTLSAAFVR
jgi:hypothetical protein